MAVRKVKNLLTGLAPTDAEVDGRDHGRRGRPADADQRLDDRRQTRPIFQAKMIGFFRNFFQQTGFPPTDDFKMQLLMNGGFDFGPLGTGAVGDDASPRLVQNLQDSFALTAWQLVADGRPFTEVLTTQRFMMTTALKSLYLQIEMPNDEPYSSFGSSSSTQAGLEDRHERQRHPARGHAEPDRAPTTWSSTTSRRRRAGGFTICPNCHGMAMVRRLRRLEAVHGRLLAAVPAPASASRRADRSPATRRCFEHASKPYLHDRRHHRLAAG